MYEAAVDRSRHSDRFVLFRRIINVTCPVLIFMRRSYDVTEDLLIERLSVMEEIGRVIRETFFCDGLTPAMRRSTIGDEYIRFFLELFANISGDLF